MKKSFKKPTVRRTLNLRLESLEARQLLAGDSYIAEYGPSFESFYLANPSHQDHAEIRFTDSGRAYYIDSFYHNHDDHNHDDHDHHHNCLCSACNPYSEQAAGNGQDFLFAELADDEPNSGGQGESDGPKVPLSEITQLASDPSAPNTFYLDFTGERIVDTDWNRNENNGLPIHARPYDIDGDVTTFSQQELDAIFEIWQRVSEDYAPFDINITTIEPPEADLIARRKAIRGIITNSADDIDMGGTGETWFPDAGGVAFIGSWLEASDVPVWVFQDKVPNTPKGIAEAVSHEFGHSVGLAHHGNDTSAYHDGHGSGETSWAPIMGTGYDRNLTQWSDGKYESANNPQNDLRVITLSFNHISYREDDHSEGNDDATMLALDDGWISGHGLIEQNNDYDSFGFEHPGGPVNLQIKPSDVGGNLDVMAILYDDSGEEISQFAPPSSTSATVAFEDLEAGTYFLDIEGSGFLPEVGLGYSDYGSLGAYTIEGTLGVTVVVADSGGLYDINEGTDLTLNASASIGTNDDSVYSWDLDGDGEYDDATGEIAVVTWEQLGQLDVPIIDDGEYAISVQVKGIDDLVDTADGTVRVANVGPKVDPIDPVQATVGVPVTFELTVTDIDADPLIFNWEVEEGSSDVTTVPTLTHTYNEPGEYTVNVSVGDDAPKVTEESFTVIVSEAIEELAGDANRNGEVNFTDFLILSTNFGKDGLVWEDGDFTGDGSAEFDDFLLLSNNFGKSVND